MSRDRLGVVLRVRELVERRRQAERATAEQAAHLAGLRSAAAAQARDEAGGRLPDGPGIDGLRLHRLGTVALSEAADAAARAHGDTRAEVEVAERRQVAAAIARRSVERLHERRSAEAATRAAKLADRQLDAVALQVWRRHS